MKAYPRIPLVWPLLFLLLGCSLNRDQKFTPSGPHVPQAGIAESQIEVNRPKGDLFVLLAEPDGKIGTIRVVNSGGIQVLDKPGDTARVPDSITPPIPTQPMEEKVIASTFGQALSAQPDLTPRFLSFTLWFESDKTRLTNVSKEKLPEILKTIQIRNPQEIHIVGHTDRVGTDSHNLKLSARRAKFVKDFFTSKGIQSKRMVISFLGETRPLVDTEDEVPEPLNRRVEVMIR